MKDIKQGFEYLLAIDWKKFSPTEEEFVYKA